MSKNWSKIYNNKSFFRNTESFKVLKNSKIKKWSHRKLSFELFKIMNPVPNKVSLKRSFMDYINFIKKNIMINKNFSILDYGSGNGSTLVYFHKKNLQNKIYSKDVNKYFINLQKKMIKNLNSEVLKPEKNFINEKTKSIDWVISNAVLHCLPNKKNARSLILEMIRIARKGVFISDIFDVRYKDKFIKEQMKRQKLSKKEYILKYKKTPHLYFKKDFFFFLKKMKFKYRFLKMPKSFYDSQFGRFAILIKI